MTKTKIPTMTSLTEDIKKIAKTLEKVVSLVEQKKFSGLEVIFWNLRADLEFLALEFKYVLKIEDKLERWQKSFFSNLRGTKSKAKAIAILRETVLGTDQTLKILEKNPKECYKYFWKLKETISSIMSAFEEKKQSGQSSADDDVFEI